MVNPFKVIMDSLPSWLTAFNAHWLFGYAVLFTWFNVPTAIALILGCGVKEFYVDKHFEHNQTFMDNLGDFGGYMLGLVLATVAHRLLGR